MCNVFECMCNANSQGRNSSFDPGGWLLPPVAKSKTPLLDVRFYPRLSLYQNDEKTGSFIVDAPLSYTSGFPYVNSTFEHGHNGSVPFTRLNVTITNSLTGKVLIPWSEVSINSTGNELSFKL